MSQATAARLIVGDTTTIGSGTAIAFNECSLAGQRTVGVHMGHRGSRQRASCRARNTTDKSAGNISGNLSVSEIDWFIPRAIGDTGSAPWIPGETINEWYAWVDKVAAIYQYNKLRIRSFEVSGQETQYLNWNFATVGELETTYGSLWPASPVADCGTAFLFSDCVLTYNSVAYPMQSFRLSVDNAIDENQYENSLTPTRFEAQDLIVQLQATCALRSDTIALYDAALAGAEASLAVSDGVTTYTFHFGNLKYMSGAPTIPARGRINMPLSFEAFRRTNVLTAEADNQFRVTKAVV